MSASFLFSGGLVGLIGDAALQLYVPEYGNDNMKKALVPYFEKWGSVPSLLSAIGLTGGVAWGMSKLASSPTEFLILSVIVDDVYREYYPWIYPTLDTYYETYDRNSTRIYNVIVAGLIWIVNEKIK